MLLGAFIALLGKIWFLFQPAASGAIYLNALTVGISVTISYVLFNTNRNSIVDIIESRSGRRIDSMVSTVDSLASKLAESGATLLLTMLLGRAGFNADLPAQPPAAIGVINFTLGWAPAIATLVMLAAAFFLPIEREYSEAKAILEGKKDECHA
jgi:GPH family glycoside/pentoside/hexuronide:cation symporter